MKVRAKTTAFDGMKRVRFGQICEVDDRLIERDASGHIVRPRWAEDVDKTLPLPVTTPYPRKSPEITNSVFVPAEKKEEVKAPAVRRGRPPRSSGSASVI